MKGRGWPWSVLLAWPGGRPGTCPPATRTSPSPGPAWSPASGGKLELAAGAPPRRGTRSMLAAACSSKRVSDHEWRAAQQAERAYQVLVAHWQQKKPPSPTTQLDNFIRAHP